jgi:2-polyprenyl-3-methyl-5-hydroxy-6-metoxy-1,4-benzoquinol methylase
MNEPFDEGYYERGERGGYNGRSWDDPEHQRQLEIKLVALRRDTGILNGRVLFVGCAQGLEVKKFNNAGYEAWGVDVSKYAIANVLEGERSRCQVYDGKNLPFGDSHFDIVASFDVLTLVRHEDLPILCKEMCRVSRRYVYFRTHVSNHKQRNGEIIGMDGVPIRRLPFDEWNRLFTDETEFRHCRTNIGHNLVAFMAFNRQS